MRYEKKNQIGTIGHQSPNLYAENFAFVFRLDNKKSDNAISKYEKNEFKNT